MDKDTTREFTIRFPVSTLPLGRWMEQHGVSITLSCALGTFHATAGTRKVLSYSDRGGSHFEDREVSRYDADPQKALDKVLAAAYALSRGEEPAE